MGVWTLLGGMAQPMFAGLEKIGAIKCPPRPVKLPVGFERQAPTPVNELRAMVEQLDRKQADWVAVGTKERVEMLKRCLAQSYDASKAAAMDAEKAKGSYGSGIGEEW